MRPSHMIHVLYALVLIMVFFATPFLVQDVAADTAITPFFAPEQEFSPIVIVGFAIAVAIFSFLILKVELVRKYLLRIIEACSLALSSAVIFYAFFRLVQTESSIAVIASAIGGFCIVLVRHHATSLQNAIVVLVCAGAAVLIGTSFTPLSVATLLVLLSIYDYVAVYRTKHMQALATLVRKENFIMSFSSGKDNDRFELGTGDVIVPSALCASTLVLSFEGSLLVATGTLLSLGALTTIANKKMEMVAALPVLALGSLAGYACSIILGHIALY